MTKYKGAYRTELEDNELSYSEEMAQQQEPEQEQGQSQDPFQKRYGDLRRHMQQKDAANQEEVNRLRSQLDQATRKQIRFPKSEEEIKKWATQYPDVAQIVETIAGMKANEVAESSRAELESIRRDTKEQKKERAYAELMNMHPDFNDLKATPEFHEWAEMQPKYIQEALYKNSTDAVAASRAIDLYKADTGKSQKKKSDPKDAAMSVGRTSGAAPTGKGRPKYSESMVQRMSDAEYDKHEKAILESMQKGQFSYDITGAAR